MQGINVLENFSISDEFISEQINYLVTSNKKVRQRYFTKLSLIRTLLSEIKHNRSLIYVVLFNAEFIPVLLERGVEPSRILFVSDSRVRSIDVQYFGVLITEITGKYATLHIEAAILKQFYKKEPVVPKTNNLVVVGNPPYQEEDGGSGRSATPIYNLFVENIIRRLRPRYQSFIIPSRWMQGGKGLDQFRAWMLAGAPYSDRDNNKHISRIVDFKSATSVFNADVAGGVCYYLWEREHDGDCFYSTAEMYQAGPQLSNPVFRRLDKYDVFVRDNVGVQILDKVRNIHTGRWMNDVVSASKPYGFRADEPQTVKGIPCWFKQSVGKKFVNPKAVSNPRDDIAKYKILVPRAPIAGQTDFTKPIQIFNDNNVIIANPGEVCSETYLVAAAFDLQAHADNFASYLRTKFFRFMLSLRVVSQDIPRDRYSWVPDIGDYSEPITDAYLYKRFGLTEDEIKHIEARIR